MYSSRVQTSLNTICCIHLFANIGMFRCLPRVGAVFLYLPLHDLMLHMKVIIPRIFFPFSYSYWSKCSPTAYIYQCYTCLFLRIFFFITVHYFTSWLIFFLLHFSLVFLIFLMMIECFRLSIPISWGLE